MNQLRLLAAMAVTGGLAACGNGGNAVQPPITQAPITSPSYATLQFAVGTANIAGQTGLNTVVTLRQQNGLSAFGYTTPVITWDGNFTNAAGAVLDKASGSTKAGNVDDNQKQISGTPQLDPGIAPPSSSFGSYAFSPEGNPGQGSSAWGAFGYGFNPSDSLTNGGPNQIIYPCLPRYAANLAAASNLSGGTQYCANNARTGEGAQYVGGPPAFPQILGAPLNGQKGAFTGFVPFLGVTPAPNPATGTSAFTLNITVPSTVGTVSLSKTARMTSFTPLGTFATPVFTPDANGGGFFAYALPAGVTEAYLLIEDDGPSAANVPGTPVPCNYGPPPHFYTVRVTPSSPNPVGLGYTGGANDPGDNLGAQPGVGNLPAGRSRKSLCLQADNATANTAAGLTDPASADQITVYAVGFDYPAFGAAYPQSNGNAAPTITGTNGQADVTMSDLSGINTIAAGTATMTHGSKPLTHAIRNF